MRFDVGFVFEVNSVFIAKVVPVRIVRVVGVSYVVDIGTFHQHHFFFHLLARNHFSGGWIGFVAVHPFQFHRHIVDVIIASRQSEFIIFGFGIADFHRSETGVS